MHTLGYGPAGTLYLETTHKAVGRVVTYALGFGEILVGDGEAVHNLTKYQATIMPTTDAAEANHKPLGPFWVRADQYGVKARMDGTVDAETLEQFQACIRMAEKDWRSMGGKDADDGQEDAGDGTTGKYAICPHCGGERVYGTPSAEADWVFFGCGYCGAMGAGNTKAEAWEALGQWEGRP